jgi:Flp pilus assembly protein TadG
MTKRGRFSVSNFWRQRSGSATVEFVCTIPLILAAMAFSFEFGRALWAHQILTENVRSAVRFLSRNELNDASRTLAGIIVSTGQYSGSTTGQFWGEDVTVTFYPSAVNPPAETFGPPDYRVSGQTIRIEAQVPVNLALLGFLGISTLFTVATADEARHVGE